MRTSTKKIFIVELLVVVATFIVSLQLTPTETAMASKSIKQTTSTTYILASKALAQINAVEVDPMVFEPASVQKTFACIAYIESRSTAGHPHLVDTSWAGAQGMYQFMPLIWRFARANIPGLPLTPNEATLAQQNSVALFYYHRNGGLAPEWTGDNC